MAVASAPPSSSSSGLRYEPVSRWGPLSTVANNRIYMWGGYSKGFASKNKNPEIEAKIEIFDPLKEQWKQATTRGSVPPKVNEGACASSGTHLYTYGGNSGFCDNGCLHQLDITSLTWKEICPHRSDGPMKKIGSGMVIYDNKIVLFGGHGVPSKSIQPGSQFAKNDLFSDGHGKTNELHLYDLKKGTWSSPTVSGQRPPPGVAFSFTLISISRALVFGGNMHELGRTNNVYSVDLKTMHWTKHSYPKGQAAPAGREGHAAACLGFGSPVPKLLITGGVDSHSKVLGDMWMLDTRTWSWKEIKNSSNQPRFDHCMEAISICPGVTEVLMFGGCPQWPKNFKSYDDFPHVAETTVARFECRDWVLSDMTNCQQLGSSHRVKEKSALVAAVPASVVADVPVPLAVITELEEKVAYAEKKAIDAVEEARESERKVADIEALLEEEKENRSKVEQNLKEEQDRVRSASARERKVNADKNELQQTLESVQHSRDEIQKLLDAKVKQVSDLQRRITRNREESQQRIQQLQDQLTETEAKLKQVEEQWLVKRDEINILKENLGGGGWGEVKVALFRGVRVAAKSLYHSIRSDYYRQLFVREMNMASRVRHPNLVQFIGACLDDEMVILMELLPTSLRKELEKPGYHLSEKTQISITLDIAQALNYLHLMKPDPIIHRDISSANVLLEPLAGNGWRAKVTDYGSVNFQKQTKTVGPGNISYAAPESHNPVVQSPKMDIFSFGVLVLEMRTGNFPDETKRKMTLSSLKDTQWKALVNKCVHENPAERPTAASLIDDIANWKT